ncbi:sugar phosphate isomerase/epimerase [Desulfofundulus sp. TPOSR]|nr:sugar phosphate isomerase/epimerase [Desulfofundulus sp. TPOSR]
MKICFNQATTMKNSRLEMDLLLCEKYGYDLIEIRLDKLRDYLSEHTVNDLKHFFDQNHIKPYAFNALEFITFRSEEEYGKIKDDLMFLCEIGQIIGCNIVIVVPTFDVGYRTKDQIKRETVRVLHDLAGTAEKYNVKLAFEFVGYPNCSVNTLGQAWHIVKEVARENVGMVLDCFHFHAMNSKFSDLINLDPHKLFVFHIDDAEDLPVGALRDEHRLLPGDGVIDLENILKVLKQIGYNEMVSVELFRPEYWEWDPETLIKVAKEKTENVIKNYFSIG